MSAPRAASEEMNITDRRMVSVFILSVYCLCDCFVDSAYLEKQREGLCQLPRGCVHEECEPGSWGGTQHQDLGDIRTCSSYSGCSCLQDAHHSNCKLKLSHKRSGLQKIM